MRILLIGPKAHGMSIGLRVLQEAFLSLDEVEICDWVGSADLLFERKAIEKEVRAIIEAVDFANYDVVNIHFGVLEVEQMLPLVLMGRQGLPPFIYSVHTLECDLLTRIGAPEVQVAINEAIGSFFDGYVFFGEYGRHEFQTRYGMTGPVIFLPARHNLQALSPSIQRCLRDRFSIPDGKPVLTLLGYASPWKDWQSLLKALATLNRPVYFTFAGPSWDKRLGFHHRRFGDVEIRVFPRYLNEEEFAYLIKVSVFGLFPYINYPCFQGSGVLPNYIFADKASIVTDVANLPEMVGDSALVVPSGDHQALRAAIALMLDNPLMRQQLAQHAIARRRLFAPRTHALQAASFFRQMR